MVLENDDPLVWKGTLAFPGEDPDPEAVKKHVAKCLTVGLLLDRQPVLWQYQSGYHVHWGEIERLLPVVRPSSAVTRQVPEALDWQWHMIADADGENQRGPFIMTLAEIKADLMLGKQVIPHHRHDRPTVHIGADHIEKRYQRICASLASTNYFTWSEATYILRDYMRGMDEEWWGRTCSQIIPEDLKERHQPHRKRGMQAQLERYRLRTQQSENSHAKTHAQKSD